MKTLRPPLFAAFAALLFTAPVCLRAADNPAPAPSGEKLYVAIAYSDPITFERYRLARMSGDELILSTLKSSAAEEARFAGYTGEVTVLDEKARAPDGAPLLTLTWNHDAVTADVTRNGKNKYLGVVNRLPLSYHPDHNHMRQEIEQAGPPDLRRDVAVRMETRMDLYMALKYLVHDQSPVATGN